MSTPPFGIHLGTLNQVKTTHISLTKLLIFASVLFLGAVFWGAIGWSVFQFFSFLNS